MLSLPARLLGENLLLTRAVPGIIRAGSGISRLMGENWLLTRAVTGMVRAGTGISRLMGENAVTGRIFRILATAGTAVGRLMEQSLDGLVLFLRKTVLKEERIRNGEDVLRKYSLSPLHRATVLAVSRILDNFSYAMMMLCIGIVLIFVLVVIALIKWG